MLVTATLTAPVVASIATIEALLIAAGIVIPPNRRYQEVQLSRITADVNVVGNFDGTAGAGDVGFVLAAVTPLLALRSPGLNGIALNEMWVFGAAGTEQFRVLAYTI